ncbi:MAG: hypothetical protein RIS47_2195 [Bacteroidota bacterium]|jgi:diamine N-acetyltransferase
MLRSNTISLRALEPEDLENLYKWENSPEVWTVSGTLAPYSHFVLKQYLANAHQDIYEARQLRLMIECHDPNSPTESTPIGMIDLFDFDPLHLRAGVGILIYDAQNRNQGHAKESLRLVIEYAFEHLQLRQLYCNILADNLYSIRLFEKAGFCQCGLKKDWVKTFDGWKDELMLQLIYT